jgi:3-hexulose-6-phosphate synthase
MLLQLAIDHPDALAIARQVADLVDILEVGTPLLKRFGLASIITAREIAPHVPVLADTKTVDGGMLEAEMVFHAGATLMTVLACADPATFDAAWAVAEKHDGFLVFDTIAGGMDRLEPTDPGSARGSMVSIHSGLDMREQSRPSRAEDRTKAASLRARGYGVAFAGGIDTTNLAHYVDLEPDVIVVGRAITAAPDPRGAAEWIRSHLHRPGHGWPWELS